MTVKTFRPEDLEPIERASQDELRALQLQRLKWTLKHAYENVPHYRAAFDAKGVHPDDLKDLETSLAAMKDNYAKGKYPAVLTISRTLTTRIAQVNTALASEKSENQAQTEELTVQWNTLSEELPAIVESVVARVASLEKSGKLPKDVDEATFARVKADSAAMAQSWQQAQGAFALFFRADLEAITIFHRTGQAPVWPEFLAAWKADVAAGRRVVVPFEPRPVPAGFRPARIETQQVEQERDGRCRQGRV